MSTIVAELPPNYIDDVLNGVYLRQNSNLSPEQVDFFNTRALEIQQEKYDQYGHQDWHKIVVNDFGSNNVEISVMPYETWSEPPPEPFQEPITVRGEGDRQRSIESATKRARRNVRQKCKLLKARYMITLTTRQIITDPEVFQKLFQEFVRRVRKAANFQYVATHELQKRGALHLHIAVANRQDYKLLTSIWQRVVGFNQGYVHVTSGNKKADVNQIAAYISKYIAKSFETGDLNKRRYWCSKGIGEAIKTVHLLRPDWSFSQVLMFIVELCKELGVKFDLTYSWGNNCDKGVFWMAATA